MKEAKFKTNINCGNCVRAVTGFLADVKGVSHWEVDTEDPNKVLVVKGETIDIEEVKVAVEDAGFDIELLPVT